MGLKHKCIGYVLQLVDMVAYAVQSVEAVQERFKNRSLEAGLKILYVSHTIFPFCLLIGTEHFHENELQDTDRKYNRYCLYH